MSKSESSSFSSAFFTLHLSSANSTVEEGRGEGTQSKKQESREHFCAESASILDRFVRLTDFERLTIERRNEDFPCRSSPSSLALSQLQLLEKDSQLWTNSL